MNTQREESGAFRWGRGILLAISALVTLNGIGWFFVGPTLFTLEQDTGVGPAELEAAYPTVAALLSLQSRNTGILLAGFGLLALAAALALRQDASGWPARTGWVFVGTLAATGLSELAAGALFGLFYLALGFAALAGQLLARR